MMMTHFKKRNPVLLLSALLLIFALLLSGCASNADSEKSAADNNSSSENSAADSSTAAGDNADGSDETTDYSKFNAYSDVVNDIYEMDGLLAVYFTVVQDQPEFALVEGMDYSMLSDAFSSYMPVKYIMESAMSYTDEAPAYPDQDALLLALNQPYCDLQDVLSDLSVYVTYEDYLEDNLAQAAELHAKLYAAVGPFDEAAWPFVDSMDVLDQETEQQALDRLKADGLNIAFYSRTILNICNEMDAEIWNQVNAAETLPVLDMTNLESLYAQYQEAYTGLTEAMEDPDQVALVTHWSEDAAWSEPYKNDFTAAVDALNTALTTFMDTARSQSDYSQSYDQFYTAVSEMIEQYNVSIV